MASTTAVVCTPGTPGSTSTSGVVIASRATTTRHTSPAASVKTPASRMVPALGSD